MRAPDEAGAFDDRRGENTRFVQQFERNTRADDIDNGVQRAYLVKMHLFGRQAVDFPFGHGDAFENRDGFIPCPIRERAALDQLFDLREIPSVFVAMSVHVPIVSAVMVMMILHKFRFAPFGAAAELQSEHRGEFVRFRQFFGRFQVIALPLELKELAFFLRANRFQDDGFCRDRRKRFS